IHDEVGKQAKFRGKIMRNVTMVIHVIAREVGEGAGLDAHAIEPELIEPVRGGFERQMRDALARDLVELTLQRDRIGRGQRAIESLLSRNQANGSDAGGFMPEPLPDLAREGDNGSLAA